MRPGFIIALFARLRRALFSGATPRLGIDDAYLAHAVDIGDLERRMHDLEVDRHACGMTFGLHAR
jgi:hypothetical protein